MNPDELAWNAVKSRGIGRMTISGADELKSRVVGCLRHLQKSPKKIRGFFSSPYDAVRYLIPCPVSIDLVSNS